MPPDDAIGARAPLSPAAVVAAIDSNAERIATPCGSGSMIWRRWGNGPALVLLHGAEGDHAMFDAFAAQLAPHFTVIAYDQRDSGGTRNPAVPYGLGELADDLAALAVPMIATSSHTEHVLHRVALPKPCAWVMGHEGQGVSLALMARCALTVGIPQPGGEESLNVAAAAAICLYESARQQG